MVFLDLLDRFRVILDRVRDATQNTIYALEGRDKGVESADCTRGSGTEEHEHRTSGTTMLTDLLDISRIDSGNVKLRLEEIDLAQPWRRARMIDLVEEATGVAVHPSQPVDDLRALAAKHGVSVNPRWGSGKIIEELFEALAEHTLIAPTFVTGHPVEISPLARVDRNDPHLTERFELFVGARELANGYSELNDPVEQRLRFEDEQAAKDAGDAERGTVDEDYLRALEYGLPPTGGLEIGRAHV